VVVGGQVVDENQRVTTLGHNSSDLTAVAPAA
jgi:aspartokinase